MGNLHSIYEAGSGTGATIAELAIYFESIQR